MLINLICTGGGNNIYFTVKSGLRLQTVWKPQLCDIRFICCTFVAIKWPMDELQTSFFPLIHCRVDILSSDIF